MVQRLHGKRIKNALSAGINWFTHFKTQLDQMNVFPVPDGDTGKNMNHAMQAALKEIKLIQTNNVSDVAWAAARGALMGGRGCSGMILSGFFSGFAEGVGERASLTAEDLARAFQIGSLRARERIDHPKEGTILSVGEAAAKTALNQSKKTDQLNAIIISAWEGAKQALARTPKQLKILADNHVVDAGGMGLVVFLEGMVRFIQRQSVKQVPESLLSEKINHSLTQKNLTVSQFKYCTEFILQAEACSIQMIKQHLNPLGVDLMVAQGEEDLYKIHIHTKDPKKVFEIVSELGMVTWKKIDDMEHQHQHRFD